MTYHDTNSLTVICTKCGEKIHGRTVKRKDNTCFDCKRKHKAEKHKAKKG